MGEQDLRKGYVFMLCLALQFGVQPLLAKEYINDDVSKVVWVLGLEGTKCVVCFCVLYSGGRMSKEWAKWTLRKSLATAGLPAMIYAVQNVLIQMAYQNLTGLIFNLINQTKTLFSATFVWLIMGKAQSPQQIVALLLLLIATIVLTTGGSAAERAENDLWGGVLPILGASALSGLASALCQRAMQMAGGTDPTVFSAELAVYSACTLAVGLVASGEGAAISARPGGVLAGWTMFTLLPIFSQAFGGIVIGQVTKHAGSVRKGFAVCFGIVVTAVAQKLAYGTALLPKHWLGLALVTASTWLHSKFPLAKVPPKKKAA